jgi:hypothetical protein
VATAHGYSGTPLAKKLGVKEGHRLALLHAPEGFEALLSPLPDDVTVLSRRAADIDVAVLFVRSTAELTKGLGATRDRMTPAGGLWIAWPKRSSGIVTDVGDAVVREVGLASGLVDNKVCAIDATWSALRFVTRLTDRRVVK